MENTIENPLMWFVIKWNIAYTDKEERDEFTTEMLEDLAKITLPMEDEIESVKLRMDELHKETSALQREIASLRSRLEDCNRKRITGARI